MKDLILVGIQGSGKGTQGKIVAQELGFQILETGSFFRALKDNDTPLAKKVKEIIDAGNLVPDDIVMEIVRDLMGELDESQPILFDGVPRTETQRLILEDLLHERGRDFRALSINISGGESLARLLKRAQKEGRVDDAGDAIKKRIAEFHARTQPMIESWRMDGRVTEIDGMGSVEDISARILTALKEGQRCKNCTCGN